MKKKKDQEEVKEEFYTVTVNDLMVELSKANEKLSQMLEELRDFRAESNEFYSEFFKITERKTPEKKWWKFR